MLSQLVEDFAQVAGLLAHVNYFPDQRREEIVGG